MFTSYITRVFYFLDPQTNLALVSIGDGQYQLKDRYKLKVGDYSDGMLTWPIFNI